MDLADIVFENRNKEYGAYYLKKKSVRFLAVSFSITLLLVLFFVGYSLAYKFYTFKPMSLPKGVLYEPTYLSEQQQIAPPEPPKPETEQKPSDLSPDKLNATPIITDSVPTKTEVKKKEPEEEKQSVDSSSSGGNPGVANGDIMVPIQRMPEFPGGEKALASYMQRNIRYPMLAKTNKVRGVVIISFVVKRDGRVDDIKVVRSLTPQIDQECVRVVSSMPVWNPAISGGRPIEITHNLPFTFSF